MNPTQPAASPVNFACTPQIHLLYCDQRKLVKWRAVNVQAPFWRLYWNNRSGAYLKSDNACHPIEPTHFTLVAPNTILSYDLTRPVEHFHTHFTVGLPFALAQSYVHRFPAKPWLVKIMQRYYMPRQTPNTDTPWRAAAALTLCWQALLTLPKHLLAITASEPRLNSLLHWWEAQEWAAISNGELASRMGMDTAAFCRLFKRIMGQPPHTYGLLRRIDRACMLLRFSDLSIKQIAEATGFYDRYHFSRMFTRMQKIGPSAFRRRPHDA